MLCIEADFESDGEIEKKEKLKEMEQPNKSGSAESLIYMLN